MSSKECQEEREVQRYKWEPLDQEAYQVGLGGIYTDAISNYRMNTVLDIIAPDQWLDTGRLCFLILQIMWGWKKKLVFLFCSKIHLTTFGREPAILANFFKDIKWPWSGPDVGTTRPLTSLSAVLVRMRRRLRRWNTYSATATFYLPETPSLTSPSKVSPLQTAFNSSNYHKISYYKRVSFKSNCVLPTFRRLLLISLKKRKKPIGLWSSWKK